MQVAVVLDEHMGTAAAHESNPPLPSSARVESRQQPPKFTPFDTLGLLPRSHNVGRSTSVYEPRKPQTATATNSHRNPAEPSSSSLIPSKELLSKIHSKSLPSLSHATSLLPALPFAKVKDAFFLQTEDPSRLKGGLGADILKLARSAAHLFEPDTPHGAALSGLTVVSRETSVPNIPLSAGKAKLKAEALGLKRAYETALKEAHDAYINWEKEQQQLMETTALKTLPTPAKAAVSSEICADRNSVIVIADGCDQIASVAVELQENWLCNPPASNEYISEDAVLRPFASWLKIKGHEGPEAILQNLVDLKPIIATYLEERSAMGQYVSDLKEKIQALEQFVSSIERGDSTKGSVSRSLVTSQDLRMTVSKSSTYNAATQDASCTGGMFEAVPDVYVNRTLNGSTLKPWVMGKKLASSIYKAGVLEAEADYIVTRPGALEPSKPRTSERRNRMYLFTDEEIALLRSMASRVKFLRNPRFPLTSVDLPLAAASDNSLLRKSRNAHLKTNRSIEGRVVATPESLFFTDYVPHQTYLKTLSIRNKTPHATRFRLSTMPPYSYSKYFEIRLKKTPIDSDGLVASGMSCTYDILFTPDSLADFELMLLVSTEIGQGTPEGPYSFVVPVISKREPPELTLSDVLHCGPCRAGYVTTRRWSFKNIGGPGKFLIVRQEDELDPYAVFETLRQRIEAGEAIDMPPVQQGYFEVQPSFFTVDSGGMGEITVTYKAQMQDLVNAEKGGIRERLDTAVLKIACDNCQVLELPLYGISQSPRVEILSCTVVEPKSVSHLPTFKDGFLTFHRQNIEATTIYAMKVQNSSRIKLSYKWVVVDYPGDGIEIEGNTWDTIPTNESFFFDPPSGILNANSDYTFRVHFTPKDERQYNVVAKLLLLDDDDRVADDGVIYKKLCSNSRNLESAIQILLTGEGIAYEITSKPEILLLPGSIPMGSTRTMSLQLHNRSIADIRYRLRASNIDERALGLTFHYDEEEGSTLKAGSSHNIKVTATGMFPAGISGFIDMLHEVGGEILLRVPLIATVNVQPGSLDFGLMLVDFGLIALGSSGTALVPLVNRSGISYRYKLSVTSFGGNEEEGKWDMDIQPYHGVIQPDTAETCKLLFTPARRQHFRGVLACDIMPIDGDHFKPFAMACVKVKAEVQSPSAKILNAKNSLSCFLNVPFTWTVVLQNTTYLPSGFTWETPKSKDFVVKFGIPQSHLGPGQKVEIPVTIQFKKQEVFKDIKLRCKIDGMLENNGWLDAVLDATVLGLKVKFKIFGSGDAKNEAGEKPDPPDRTTLRRLSLKPVGRRSNFVDRLLWPDGGPFTLDFGVDCPIFANRSRTLVIRNRSAIAAPFRTWVETYTATGIDEEEEESFEIGEKQGKFKEAEESFKGKISTRGLLLQPSKKEKIGFSSDVGKAWIESTKAVRRTISRMNHLLREGRGAAFHASPSYGTIEPFGEVQITLTSYNNLVGQYEDRFVCEVGNIRESIPIFMGVDGQPVRFMGAQLMAAKSSDNLNRVNFGTRLIQVAGHSQREKISKVIQVENLSPRTIMLKWRLYVKRQAMTPFPESSGGRPQTAFMDSDQLTQPENEVDISSTACPISLIPHPTTISAFKTIQLRIHFSSELPGSYQIMLTSEVWYVQPNGTLSLSPVIAEKITSVVRPNLLPGPTSHASSNKPAGNLTAALANNPLCNPQAGRQVQLLVLGKLVQPHLSLEDGAEAIHMKPGHHLRSMASFSVALPHHDFGAGLSLFSNHSEDGSPTAVVVLKNTTDASCEFGITAEPSNMIKVVRADVAITPSAASAVVVSPSPQGPGGMVAQGGTHVSLGSSKFTLNRGLRTGGNDGTESVQRSASLRREEEQRYKNYELNPNDKIVVVVQCFGRRAGKEVRVSVGAKDDGQIVGESIDSLGENEECEYVRTESEQEMGNLVVHYTNGFLQRIPIQFA